MGDTDVMRKRILGSLVGVLSALALGGALLPIRADISVSTTALVLVIPVVVGTAVGGLVAGVTSVVAGFLVYDYAFIKPYWTLAVGATQNWTALVVYVVVMLLVVRIVDTLEVTRTEATRGHEVMRRMSEVSELLVADQPLDGLLKTIVATAQTVFNVPGVSLLELEEGHLVVVASVGEPLTAEELRLLNPQSGVPIRVGTGSTSERNLRTVALTSSDRPVGILAMRGLPIPESERAILHTFANDAALALERAHLREQALRSQLLEEADRFRRGLMGAVSHDLRTPLATIKVASSTLFNNADSLSKEDAAELHHLIEIESDRLTRLVTNLLDITRIEAGVLSLHRRIATVPELINEAVLAMTSVVDADRIHVETAPSLPAVNVDTVLTGQVLINLLDNAHRHAPEGTPIILSGELRGDQIVMSVTDQGPGVETHNRETIFDRFTQFDTGGRAGLGLTIAKTFVEAHGEHIWYEEPPNGGARFLVSLSRASL